jgi:aryl-alcohol dehydrogenase-like predicted oxidoreductase/predicted kinase
MRLSTEQGRDDESSIKVLQAALDSGITLIDTANAYALDDGDIGQNERLIARALSSWGGDQSRVTVMTKGGLTRPAGRWLPDGRARALTAACHASCEALGLSRIALYQLHAPDPRVPFATSLRALAALQRNGVVAEIGLCNVTRGQIEEARRIVEIAAVQIELNPWNDKQVATGVVPYCLEHGLRVLAYRPFNGVKGKRRIETDERLCEIAAAHDTTPYEIILAWMRSLAPQLVPLPGVTRIETARSCGHAASVVLGEREQAALDRLLPLGVLRGGPSRARVAVHAPSGENIIMVMGLPGAGKTTHALRLVQDGYERLNRDEAGGTLADMARALGARLAAGASRVVLDNTYISRASRAAVIATAAACGRGVHGVWLDTSVEDAQVNVVRRMLRTHGRLLLPPELAGRTPESIAPSALFRAARELEPPQIAEGFAQLDVIRFARGNDPAWSNRAVILGCDGALRRSRSGLPRPSSADDVETIGAHRDTLARYQAEGWRLLSISWEPEVTERDRSVDDVERGFDRLRTELALDIEFHYCPHGGGPPVCWCRQPLPGLGVLLIDRHHLHPPACTYVGSAPQARAFARRLGFQFQRTAEFFDDVVIRVTNLEGR